MAKREKKVLVWEKVEQFAFVTRRKDEPERRAQNTKGGRGQDEGRVEDTVKSEGERG